MRNALFSLIALLSFAIAPAQDIPVLNLRSAVIASVSMDSAENGFELYCEHKDGTISLFAFDAVTGEPSGSYFDGPQQLLGDQGQDPMPATTLTTTWTDDNGVTHTVTTPIPSSTPAGLNRSRTLHLDMVRWMQQIYPPRTT